MREGERERGGGEARGEGRDLCRDDGLRFEGGGDFFSSSFPESRARFSVAAKKTSPGLNHMDEILKSIRRSGKLDKVLPHPNRRRRWPSNILATTFFALKEERRKQKKTLFSKAALALHSLAPLPLLRRGESAFARFAPRWEKAGGEEAG